MKKKLAQEDGNSNNTETAATSADANNATTGAEPKPGRIMTRLAPSVSSNKVSETQGYS